MSKHIFNWLALGDSYTIGEGVPLHLSYPYQSLQGLRSKGLQLHAPEVIAQTGWTTSELAEHLIHHQLEEHYDVVTVLIGVNNQYREFSIDDYAIDMEFLLHKALHYARHITNRVVVISIPDWGVTPFANGKNITKIATEIDAYNAVTQGICKKNNVHFIDITTTQRQHGHLPQMLTADDLHPSAKEYALWANELTDYFFSVLS